MLKNTEEKQLGGFFKRKFCRVTPAVVGAITKVASEKGKTFSGQTWVKNIDHESAEKIYRALQETKLRSPPTDCLAPIGVRTMLAGMLKGVKAEFYAASTRSPAVYRGNPFQIEAAIGFGGDLPGDQPARVIRFANRVPLLYQQSACSAFKSVTETGWKNYGMSQPRGSAPVGPMVIMIHMASVWVPFTSESKEAIADYDEIRKEMKLALQECGRKLGTYIRRRQRMKREGQKRDVFERYIGEISKACEAITGADAAELYESLMKQAKRRTEIADAVLDEDGKIVSFGDGNGRLDNDDGVIIVGDDGAPNEPRPSGSGSAKPSSSEDAEKTAPSRSRLVEAGWMRGGVAGRSGVDELAESAGVEAIEGGAGFGGALGGFHDHGLALEAGVGHDGGEGGSRVRDELERHRGQRGRVTPIGVVAGELDPLALDPFVELECARADGRLLDVLAAFGRDDHRVAPGHVEEELAVDRKSVL